MYKFYTTSSIYFIAMPNHFKVSSAHSLTTPPASHEHHNRPICNGKKSFLTNRDGLSIIAIPTIETSGLSGIRLRRRSLSIQLAPGG